MHFSEGIILFLDPLFSVRGPASKRLSMGGFVFLAANKRIIKLLFRLMLLKTWKCDELIGDRHLPTSIARRLCRVNDHRRASARKELGTERRWPS